MFNFFFPFLFFSLELFIEIQHWCVLIMLSFLARPCFLHPHFFFSLLSFYLPPPLAPQYWYLLIWNSELQTEGSVKKGVIGRRKKSRKILFYFFSFCLLIFFFFLPYYLLKNLMSWSIFCCSEKEKELWDSRNELGSVASILNKNNSDSKSTESSDSTKTEVSFIFSRIVCSNLIKDGKYLQPP